MGRLRDDFEAPLIRGMTEEIVDLFGLGETYLYRWSAADNLTNKDPLWSEPTTVPQYKTYKIKAHRLEPEQESAGDPEGRDETATATLFVALNHLLQSFVPADDQGDYVNAGDVIECYVKGINIYYDIIKVNKTGYVNDADKFAGYNLDCVRREKYAPERKL